MSLLYIKAYGIYVCARVCICIRIYVLTKTNLVLPRDTINVTPYGPHEQKKYLFMLHQHLETHVYTLLYTMNSVLYNE